MWPRPLLRNVSVLASVQAFFFMANTIVISTSPLVGLHLAPEPMWATLPLGCQFLGTMAATMPASLLMKQIGRRFGLLLGSLFGMAAGLIGAYAIIVASFALFILAAILYGVFGAFCQYYRFTAADAADAVADGTGQAYRGRAIGWVMAGGIVAAVVGPEIAKATRDLIAPFVFAGSYAAVASLAVLSSLVLLLLDLPRPTAEERRSGGRPLLEIVRQPTTLTAYLTMNLLMTATPLAMLACGHAFDQAAMVIQWHVFAMFAPSFVTGHLIGRFGEDRIIAAGAALMLACVVINLTGVEVVQFASALFVLGLGWNFMFIGGTTLLTRCHSAGEKAKVQGLNDLLLFTAVAASATSSGFLHDLVGWQVMNLLALPLVLVVLAVVVVRRGREETRAAA